MSLTRLSKLFLRGGLVSSLWVMSGNGVSSILAALTIALLAKELGLLGFGVFSASMAVLLTLSQLLELGFNLSIQRRLARTEFHNWTAEDRSLVYTGWWIKFGLSIISLFLGWMFSGWVATTILHIDESAIIFWAFALVSVLLWSNYWVVVLQSMHRFELVSGLTIFQAVLKLVGVLLMRRGEMVTPLSALVLYGTTPIVAVVTGMWMFRKNLLKRPERLMKNLRLLRQVGVWTSIAILTAAAVDNIDVLLVQNLLDSSATGLYNAGFKLASLFSIVGLSVGTVLSIRVARYSEVEHLKSYMRKSLLFSSVCLVVALCLLPVSGLLLKLTVGPEFLEANNVLRLLLLSTGIVTATSPFAALFYLFDAPDYYTWSGIMLLVLIVGLDLLLIPSMGILGAGLAKLIARIVVLLFTLIYSWRLYAKAVRS